MANNTQETINVQKIIYLQRKIKEWVANKKIMELNE